MKKPLLILFMILCFGTFLRFSFGHLLPPSPNWDEVSLGYNAYSLSQPGRDEWGQAIPTIFQAYGDFKLPVYIYSQVPFIKLFGLNTFSIRLPSVIAGILLILLIYLLAVRIFHRQIFGLLAALLMAIQPWDLFLSRLAVEANLCLLLITMGVTLLVYKKYIWAILFLGLSVWTYNTARIFTPLFLVGFYILNRQFIRLRLSHLLILMLFFIPMFIQLFSPVGSARFNWVSLIDSGAVAGIIENRNSSSLPPPLPRLIYNRPIYFLLTFTQNYLSHFSKNFLFINGGSQYQFNIPQTGLLAAINLPFFYLGLFLLFFTPQPQRKLIILWLLLAPVAGSMTRDSPHTLRVLVMYPAVLLTIIIGLRWIISKSTRIILLYLLILFISLGYYIFISAPKYLTNYAWSWQYGYRQAIAYIKDHYSEYDQIIITKRYGEPHEFILFYWPWSPAAFRSDQNLTRYFRSNWYWVDSFDKFKFVNDWEMRNYVDQLPPNQKYLIISSPENLPNAHTLKQINFPNRTPAFIIQKI